MYFFTTLLYLGYGGFPVCFVVGLLTYDWRAKHANTNRSFGSMQESTSLSCSIANAWQQLLIHGSSSPRNEENKADSHIAIISMNSD